MRGAWGHGSFDNDAALDLVDELTAAKTWHPVSEAFSSVIEVGADYPEAPEASRALASAEVIAAALGRPATMLPDAVASWVKSKKAPKAELVQKAHRVVERVLNNSE